MRKRKREELEEMDVKKKQDKGVEMGRKGREDMEKGK